MGKGFAEIVDATAEAGAAEVLLGSYRTVVGTVETWRQSFVWTETSAPGSSLAKPAALRQTALKSSPSLLPVFLSPLVHEFLSIPIEFHARRRLLLSVMPIEGVVAGSGV